MAAMDETVFFGMEQGCPIHGEEYITECTMCGAEFCRLCYPNTTICSDCAAEGNAESEGEDVETSDFDDVENVGDLLDDSDMDEKGGRHKRKRR